MSVHDQAAGAVISQVALAADGAVLGLGLAYIAVRSVLKFKTTSSALNKVKKAPSVSVSDLRSVLPNTSDHDKSTIASSDEKLVIVRGVVETKSVVNGNSKKQKVLVSHESNEKAVILQRTKTVGLLDKEKILPVGKEITAVGTVSFKNGIPEMMASKDLPFFLSNMNKDQMVAKLDFRTKVLLWSAIVIGSLATAILGYAVVRNWKKLKQGRQQRQIQQQNAAADVPEGQLSKMPLFVDRGFEVLLGYTIRYQ